MPVAVLAVDSVCHESPDQDFPWSDFNSVDHPVARSAGEVPGAYTQRAGR